SSPTDPAEAAGRGIDLLVELARRDPSVEVELLWRPWGAADAMIAAVRRGAPPNVRISCEDVPNMAAAYARVHAVAAPFARDVGKPCPNSLIEGLAAGRPAIATAEVGISALLDREGAGVRVERTIEGLAAGLRVLRAD